jgi:hypothetical protein
MREYRLWGRGCGEIDFACSVLPCQGLLIPLFEGVEALREMVGLPFRHCGARL